MRGTHQTSVARWCRRGIIPAYAGNTAQLQLGVQDARDHPRVCGEHFKAGSSTVNAQGSSPRMRGTPWLGGEREGRLRIIPAYAGNTGFHEHVIGIKRDHPRVCGEHSVIRCSLTSDPGSSPRMRGTLIVVIPPDEGAGIIPAYAGNPGRPPVRCPSTEDHPRVCGEHLNQLAPAVNKAGSSPRMRGTLSLVLAHLPLGGIIPAYAGNTRFCR